MAALDLRDLKVGEHAKIKTGLIHQANVPPPIHHPGIDLKKVPKCLGSPDDAKCAEEHHQQLHALVVRGIEQNIQLTERLKIVKRHVDHLVKSQSIHDRRLGKKLSAAIYSDRSK